ncbi:MAG: hypothetical protein FWD58_00905 [Firmicutes bacterium]|nr:hypothetical protein [Bacillota bacterium]
MPENNLPPIFLPDKPATVSEWENFRRPELLGLFSDYVYGRTPSQLPEVSHELTPGKSRYPDIEHSVLTLTMKLGGKACAFRSDIYRPKPLSPILYSLSSKLPVIIMIDPFSSRFFRSRKAVYEYCPPDVITNAGFIAIRARVDEACPDKPGRRGLLGLYDGKSEELEMRNEECRIDNSRRSMGSGKQSEKNKSAIPHSSFLTPNSRWGAIGAWAFCVSRFIDYLLTRGDVDPARIAVCGHSRAGKTALWCGAQDTRVGAVISNNSGCSGAALARGKAGERIADITKRFPYWFCPRYAEFSGRENDLPVDQHQLLSLIAPRPLYIASASKDRWADPDAELLSVQLCGEAYALYETCRGDGLIDKLEANVTASPANNARTSTGLSMSPSPRQVGYHLRSGRHAVKLYDWERFLAFLNQKF